MVKKLSDGKVSRLMSLKLRHNPGDLAMDKQGWVDTIQLAMTLRVDKARLDHIVATNDKQRFEYNEDESKIRARQGHSIEIDHGYEPMEPPEKLYHGTVKDALDAIMKTGLDKMKRHHVHLSQDKETATKVGDRRRSKTIILVVQAKRMHDAGFKFYKTDNNVWLVDRVPPEYLGWS
jgi:putative RNA 2'-phosphotransferase